MAVLVEALSVIVKRDAIEKKFKGGWRGFRDIVTNGTLCYENELARVGFMSPDEVDTFLSALASNGLDIIHKENFVDVAVVDQVNGPTIPTSWLEFGKLPCDDDGNQVSACWLFEDERKGAGLHFKSLEFDLALPFEWTFNDSMSKNFKFVKTDVSVFGDIKDLESNEKINFIPEQRFSNFKDANKFASKLAKAKQSPMVKRDQGEWIVVIHNNVKTDPPKSVIKPIALNYQCKSEVPKIINQAGTSRQSDAAKADLVNLAVPPTIQITRKLSIIKEMNIKDFSILVANNFKNCDIAMLAKMKNRLIEIGADSDVMESIKLAIERSKPRGQWTMDVDGIGGSRDAIKRMKGQDFNDMRKRGR